MHQFADSLTYQLLGLQLMRLLGTQIIKLDITILKSIPYPPGISETTGAIADTTALLNLDDLTYVVMGHCASRR